MRTPETCFSYDEDIRFEKEFQASVDYRLPELEAKFKERRVPLRTNRERKDSLRRKLKAAVLAVVFNLRLRKQLLAAMVRRKRKAQKYCREFVGFTERLIHNYYARLLREEFADYVQVL